MVVGHEPAFSEVIKELTGGEVKIIEGRRSAAGGKSRM